MKCSCFQLKSSLKYSKNICKQCNEKLISSLEFQQTIINIQKILNFCEDDVGTNEDEVGTTEDEVGAVKKEPELILTSEILVYSSIVPVSWDLKDLNFENEDSSVSQATYPDQEMEDSSTPTDASIADDLSSVNQEENNNLSTSSSKTPLYLRLTRYERSRQVVTMNVNLKEQLEFIYSRRDKIIEGKTPSSTVLVENFSRQIQFLDSTSSPAQMKHYVVITTRSMTNSKKRKKQLICFHLACSNCKHHFKINTNKHEWLSKGDIKLHFNPCPCDPKRF